MANSAAVFNNDAQLVAGLISSALRTLNSSNDIGRALESLER